MLINKTHLKNTRGIFHLKNKKNLDDKKTRYLFSDDCTITIDRIITFMCFTRTPFLGKKQ